MAGSRGKREIEQGARSRRLLEENSLSLIMAEARELAEALPLLVMPVVLTRLLQGKKVNLESEVRALASDPLKASGRHRKRFGDSERVMQTIRDTRRTYDLILAVTRELEPLSGRKSSEAEKRKALLAGGVPRARVERALDSIMPVRIPRLGRGLRGLSVNVAACAAHCELRTAENRFKAWSRLLALLQEAPLDDLRGLFVRERRVAFRDSPLGTARLRHLRAKRRRARNRRRKVLEARRRGQKRAVRGLPR